MAALLRATSRPTPGMLAAPAGATVPLSLEPRGKVVARVSADAHGPFGEGFERRDGFVRVAVGLGDFYVFGWVPGTSFAPNAAGVGYGSGYGSVGGSAPEGERTLRCSADVTLLARAGEQRAVVGSIAAGTILDGYERQGAFTRVLVRDSRIEPARDAAFLVAEAELERCTPATR